MKFNFCVLINELSSSVITCALGTIDSIPKDVEAVKKTQV
jgi:hypothetical protein